MTDDIIIIKIKRPDNYTCGRTTSVQPNRIPWNVFYLVMTEDRDKIAKLFKTAWVIFPSAELSFILRQERHIPPNAYGWCILVPTYVNKYKQYAYTYSRHSYRAKGTTFGEGLGKIYFLENGVFLPPCFYCQRSAYFLVGDCTPGTNSCLTTFWRGVEHQP